MNEIAMQQEQSLLSLLAEKDQPDTIFQAVDRILKDSVGHKLLTMLYVDGGEVARVYSNDEKSYPVFGRKPMGATPWGDLVLKNQQPFLGKDRDSIIWAFFDHELIFSLGLGSAINIPVIYNGETIGTINLLDAEYAYDKADVEKAKALAPFLIPAFLEARRAK